MTTVTVSAGNAFALPVKIEAKNFRLSWEFETISYDIQFGIRKVLGNEGTSYIYPLCTFQPNQMHQESIIIEESGSYELVWDNTHSWLREKNINYKVDAERMQMTNQEKSVYNK